MIEYGRWFVYLIRSCREQRGPAQEGCELRESASEGSARRAQSATQHPYDSFAYAVRSAQGGVIDITPIKK